MTNEYDEQTADEGDEKDMTAAREFYYALEAYAHQILSTMDEPLAMVLIVRNKDQMQAFGYPESKLTVPLLKEAVAVLSEPDLAPIFDTAPEEIAKFKKAIEESKEGGFDSFVAPSSKTLN